MKKTSIGLTIILSLILMISCSDDDDGFTPITEEDTMLAVSDTVCMMFRSMNGSSDGGIDGMERGKYRELHHRSMNSAIFEFDDFVENSSITFIAGTDSVKIRGYVDCGYVKSGSQMLVSAWNAHDAIVKYKFENNALKVLIKPENNEWATLGYGNKEKIEVYIETKAFHVGAMITDPNHTDPNMDDKYVWEINGTTRFEANISVTPEQANKTVETQYWQDFFDEVQTNWIYIPVGKYYGETFKSQQDMKRKYQGATWSVYKMTYTPKEL
ncbi:MAG: hypothetical protein LBV71_20535 [Prevotella sp.]|jgi:hypothetical protein|nr:hypothetical protein [Prevotella sp.]